MSRLDQKEIDEVNRRLSTAELPEILTWALDRFGARVALSCSFSTEDLVILDALHSLDRPFRVFALDTGRVNEETYQTADRVIARYGTKIEWYFPAPDGVERLERTHGLYSFRESLERRHECCSVRKLEPLDRALLDLDAWMTGLMREQSVTRSEVRLVEIDAAHGGIAKLNPLCHWTSEGVWKTTRGRDIPHNPLYDRGYASIGCAPCTRPIGPHEHPRAGRWWWELPEQKECGLHADFSQGGGI
ncbi:MAG: phosphoadenylyl-sulfate reductase [Deltaproteobacteria bacterium]|nr:phosphoadenylyl-sulfate reductase [Deltaproteobacteria bacterium]